MANRTIMIYLAVLLGILVITERLFPTQVDQHPEIVVYETIGLGIIFSIILVRTRRKGNKK